MCCACVHILILTFVSQEEEGKWREETKETKKVVKRPRIVIVCNITKNRWLPISLHVHAKFEHLSITTSTCTD